MSFPIGIAIAWLLGRSKIPHGRALEFFFWLSYFLPPLSATLGWMLLLDPRGVLNNFLAQTFHITGPFNIYSFAGIVWVHLMRRATSSRKVILLTPAVPEHGCGA